jgi:hypothetical protein
MADNLTVQPDHGSTTEEILSFDELAGAVLVQRVKIQHGVDGTATDASSLNPLPVTGTMAISGTPAVTISGTPTVSVSSMPADTTGTYLEDSAHVSGDRGALMLGIRRDTDSPSVDADGDYAPFLFDEEGRGKVSTKPASFPIVSGNITAVAGTLAADVSRASNVMLMMNTSALAGHNCTFEGSLDSTNGTDGVWFVVQAIRSNANTIETATGALAATPAYAWEMSVNGLAWVRVRATAHTSGTATWKIQRGSYATEPIPAAQISGTQPVSGAVTATVTPATPTAYHLSSAATTNATAVKASAGTVYGITVSNANAAARYLKLYNKATAPTVGTDIPILTVPIPATGLASVNFGALGHRLSTGIGIALTTGMAYTDATAVALNEIEVTMAYI